MDVITIIEYMAVVVVCFYVINLIVVWAYEFKRNSSYHQMQHQIRQLEGFRLSTAVLHAKMYRVMEDYRRDVLSIERVQQFILENLLFIIKRSERNDQLGSWHFRASDDTKRFSASRLAS